MDKQRLQELAGVSVTEAANIVSSGKGNKIDEFVTKLAQALYKEGIVLAKEVYELEGPGKSGAKNEQEYVQHAIKQFLSPDYKRDIIQNIEEEYNDLVKGENK